MVWDIIFIKSTGIVAYEFVLRPVARSMGIQETMSAYATSSPSQASVAWVGNPIQWYNLLNRSISLRRSLLDCKLSTQRKS